MFDGVQKSDLKNTHILADACQGLALYMSQTLIRGLNTFTFTCAVRYFKPLIIIQVTELCENPCSLGSDPVWED